MKIVINECYGGFSLPVEFIDHYDIYGVDEDAYRTDPRLINFVENCENGCYKGSFSRLVVAEIPDEATDYIIEEYDGLEYVYYVIDGKIYCAD